MVTLSTGMVERVIITRVLPAMATAVGCVDGVFDSWRWSIAGAKPIGSSAVKVSRTGAVSHAARVGAMSYHDISRAGHPSSVTHNGGEREH